MDRGAWWATVLGVTESWTPLKQFSMHTYANTNSFTVTMAFTLPEENNISGRLSNFFSNSFEVGWSLSWAEASSNLGS